MILLTARELTHMLFLQVIHSFETDFSNGYLFGEILCQYGIYDDIKLFSKK